MESCRFAAVAGDILTADKICCNKKDKEKSTIFLKNFVLSFLCLCYNKFVFNFAVLRLRLALLKLDFSVYF